MTILEKIASFENLLQAFSECSRGKRRSSGYQRASFAYGERLITVQKKLLADSYLWNGYREMIVKDPKTRLVMAAPFMDRVVHTAIHRVLEPIFEPYLSSSVYACRKNKGNRYAAIDLFNILKTYGPQRFVIKLDVKKYFHSISHEILLSQIFSILPDNSIEKLLISLLNSQPTYAKNGYGIPIGNLSSQLFANLYLIPADEVALKGIEDGFYFRYMDDMVIGGKNKRKVLDTADTVISLVNEKLKLSIPFEKKMPIGNGPVPFLGYVLDHTGYRVLARNYRRHTKRITRLIKSKAKPSELAMRELSFEAFASLV